MDYRYNLRETADSMFDKGLEYWEHKENEGKWRMKRAGHHTNAYTGVRVKDYLFSETLVEAGLGDSIFLRPGYWRIGDKYYSPSTCKWSSQTDQKHGTADSFEDFVENIL